MPEMIFLNSLFIFQPLSSGKYAETKVSFFKKSYVLATWSFYINPVQQKISKRWLVNVEVINCKKA